MQVPEDPSTAPQTVLRQRPRELAMCLAWHAGLTRNVTTTDGQTISIVFPGHWSHGFGPDFSDAMLEFSDDGFRTGAVELHSRSSDWLGHGHHIDERYNSVVLHVVSIDDLAETRRADGKIIPVANLSIPDDMLFAIDRRLPGIWADLGGSVCAADLSMREPARIRKTLHRLGDLRLAAKTTTIEGVLVDKSPDVALLELLFDGFGYSENRGPMRQLAQIMTRYGVTTNEYVGVSETPSAELLGIMLGIGGFLPLSPSEAHAGGILPEDQYRIERAWRSFPANIANDVIPATAWQTARTRPVNHPVARLMQAASLLARSGGDPLPALLDAIRTNRSPVGLLQEWTMRPGHPGLGTGRATAIVASVVVPFALAWAAHANDADLDDMASRVWVSLTHAGWTRPGKRALLQVTGGPPVRGLGERGHQGLLHLDRILCTPRRCFECPIAAEVVRDRSLELH